jgi:hypothetical protein
MDEKEVLTVNIQIDAGKQCKVDRDFVAKRGSKVTFLFPEASQWSAYIAFHGTPFELKFQQGKAEAIVREDAPENAYYGYTIGWKSKDANGWGNGGGRVPHSELMAGG